MRKSTIGVRWAVFIAGWLAVVPACGSPPAPARPAAADVLQGQDDFVYVAPRPPALPLIEAGAGMKTYPKESFYTSALPPEVLDPGSEPRRMLVYTPRPGSSETVEVTIDNPAAGPPMIETVDVEIVDLVDGWFSARLHVVAAYAEPRPTDWRSAEESTASFAKVVGSKLAATISVFGDVGEAAFTSTSEAASIVGWRGLRFHRTVPFPRQAVGQGARWQQVREHKGLGSVETVTITRLEGDRVWLSSTTSYSNAPDGTVTATAEWEVRLDRLCAAGTARVQIEGKPDKTSVHDYRPVER